MTYEDELLKKSNKRFLALASNEAHRKHDTSETRKTLKTEAKAHKKIQENEERAPCCPKNQSQIGFYAAQSAVFKNKTTNAEFIANG